MGASLCRVAVGIPLLISEGSNRTPLAGDGTMSGGQFDWGGRLQKGNGGVQRLLQYGRKSYVECKRIRQPNCETDRSSSNESWS